MTTQVLVGDRVRWDARDGTKRGEVIQIFNTQDDFGDYVNFYRIEYNDNYGGTGIALVSDAEFADVDFKVIFRNIDVQIARGERNADGSFRDYDREADQYDYEKSVEM